MVKAILVLIFMVLSALFSGLETGITTINKAWLRASVKKGKKLAQKLQEQLRNTNYILGVLLVGNNISNIVCSTLSASLAMSIFGEKGAVFSAVVVTLIIFIFCEIVPKTTFLRHSSTLTLLLVPLLSLFSFILKPIVFVVLSLSRALTSNFFPVARVKLPSVTKEELKYLISSRCREEGLSRDELLMISRSLDFFRSTVKEVMLPLAEMVAVPEDMSLKEIISLIKRTGYSRVPVYKERIDNPVGVIYFRDLLLPPPSAIVARDIMHPPFFVPEGKSLDSMLKDFQETHQEMAIVVDEYGSAVGLLTVEDLIEEIVGDIFDEYDQPDFHLIEKSPEGGFIINARAEIDKINEICNFKLPKKNFETLSGLIITLLQRIPHSGETFRLGNLKFTILEATKRKVLKVKLEKLPSLPQKDLSIGTNHK